MKIVHIFAIALVAFHVSCEEQKAHRSSSSPRAESANVTAPDYKEVWIMQGWVGNMGVMIGLKDTEYDYYFYSDVGPDRSKNPLRGTYVRNDDGITLIVPNNDSELDVYDKVWRFVKDGNTSMLASAEDLKAGRDSGRWLRKVDLTTFKKYYDPKNPFLLQMNPHLEPQNTDQHKKTEQDATRNH